MYGQRKHEVLPESELEHGLGEAAETQLVSAFDFAGNDAALVGWEVHLSYPRLQLLQHLERNCYPELLQTQPHFVLTCRLVGNLFVGQGVSIRNDCRTAAQSLETHLS